MSEGHVKRAAGHLCMRYGNLYVCIRIMRFMSEVRNMMSGVTPKYCWAPPYVIRKPVYVYVYELIYCFKSETRNMMSGLIPKYCWAPPYEVWKPVCACV